MIIFDSLELFLCFSRTKRKPVKKCIGYASWVSHLNHESICLLSAENFNLSTCKFLDMPTMQRAPVLFSFFMAFVSFLSSILILCCCVKLFNFLMAVFSYVLCFCSHVIWLHFVLKVHLSF